jgi:peroxiredoxin
VAVPGAFTPTCQEQHITSYLGNLDKLKAKGVDSVVFIASNDAFVMSAWGKANGIKDDSIVSEPLSLHFPISVSYGHLMSKGSVGLLIIVTTALHVGQRRRVQPEHWLGCWGQDRAVRHCR